MKTEDVRPEAGDEQPMNHGTHGMDDAPRPVELSGDKYPAMIAEIDRFAALAEERFGVSALVILYTWRDDKGRVQSGQNWRGDPLAAFGLAKKYAIEQEALWTAGAAEDED